MKKQVPRRRDSSVDRALDGRERMELCWAGETGDAIPDFAADAYGACERGTKIANRDVFGEVFDAGECRAYGLDCIGIISD